MTHHILDLINQRQLEVQLAKAKLDTPPVEVAQIIYYMRGSDVGHAVRYSDMVLAKKQFDAFTKALKKGGEFLLTGASTTAFIVNTGDVQQAILVNQENQIYLMCDYQKRVNARMQLA